jgi:hypothetical protein
MRVVCAVLQVIMSGVGRWTGALVWMRVVCAVLQVIMSGVGRWTGGSVWLRRACDMCGVRCMMCGPPICTRCTGLSSVDSEGLQGSRVSASGHSTQEGKQVHSKKKHTCVQGEAHTS